MRLAFSTVLLAACGMPTTAVPTPSGTFAGAVSVWSRMNIEYNGARGRAKVGGIHLTDSVGTIDYDGESYPAIGYEHIPWGTYNLDLGAIVATTRDGFLVTYAYCEQGSLINVYNETLTMPPTDESPRPAGTCAFTDGGLAVAAAFVRPDVLEYSALSDVANVDGADLSIHHGMGTVNIDGATFDVRVFTHVDCSTCGGDGWQELHATITHGESVLAFGIFYLQAAWPGFVALEYGFRFDQPALWPPYETFAASWSLK